MSTIKSFEFGLQLKDKNISKIFKPRIVPFTLKEKVKEELERMEKLGVIKKTELAKSVSPIVSVVKKNGSVRICGNFRYLNDQLKSDIFP